jgi:hypothetical protein
MSVRPPKDILDAPSPFGVTDMPMRWRALQDHAAG